MFDPIQILGPEFDEPVEFGAAYQAAVQRLDDAARRFEQLAERLPESAFADDEWQIVERAAADLEAAAERADEGFLAVQFDSHAWYRIMESLEQATRRLESACGVLELVRSRPAELDGAAEGAG